MISCQLRFHAFANPFKMEFFCYCFMYPPPLRLEWLKRRRRRREKESFYKHLCNNLKIVRDFSKRTEDSLRVWNLLISIVRKSIVWNSTFNLKLEVSSSRIMFRADCFVGKKKKWNRKIVTALFQHRGGFSYWKFEKRMKNCTRTLTELLQGLHLKEQTFCN